MDLAFSRVVATIDIAPGTSEEQVAAIGDLSAATTVPVGPLEVVLSGRAGGFDWSVSNRGDWPVSLRSIAIVARVAGVAEPLRMFRHGYQSWSPSGVAVLGVDTDPSERAGFPFVQGVYHADSRRVRPGELRSEWCTVLADGGGGPGGQVVLGFDGGHEHDGTFRLRRGDAGGAESWMEAFVGGATFAPGERRNLHGVRGPTRTLRRRSCSARGRAVVGRGRRRAWAARSRSGGAAGTTSSRR